MVSAVTGRDGVLAAEMRAYFRNSGWLLIEYAVRALSGLLVGIQVARHLGPQAFGLLNYALAVVALITPLARLGLDAIVIKRLATTGHLDPAAQVGTAFRIRFVMGLVSILAVVSFAFLGSDDSSERLCLVVIATGLLFQATDVIDLFYQAKRHATLPSMCRSAAVVLAAGIKLLLVWQQAGLEAFAFATLLEQVLLAIFLAAIHAWRNDRVFPGHFDTVLTRPLLDEARPLLISSVAVAAYTRADQVMLRNLLGPHELGIYSAAINLSEITYFLPLLFAGLAFPIIVTTREHRPADYVRFRRGLYRGLLLGAIVIASVVSNFAQEIVFILYGPSFSASARLLVIHVWTLVFVAYSAIFTRVLLSLGQQWLILRLTLIGLGVNLAGLWLLTPHWGLTGAAWAALLSHASIAAVLLSQHASARKDLIDAIDIRRKRVVS